MDDLNGHGTQVAGIAAGDHSGTAPAARIVNVKTSSGPALGRGRLALTTTAIHQVRQFHESQRSNPDYRGGVLNLSFMMMTAVSPAYLEYTVNLAATNGLILVASASNSGAADDISPCAYEAVVCVGATDTSHEIAPFSDYRRSVNIYAPGIAIRTLSNQSDTAVTENGVSGTSSAVPHVAGVAGTFVSWEWLYNGWATSPGVNYKLPTAFIRVNDNSLRGILRGPDGAEQYFCFGRDEGGRKKRAGSLIAVMVRSLQPNESKMAPESRRAVRVDDGGVTGHAARSRRAKQAIALVMQLGEWSEPST